MKMHGKILRGPPAAELSNISLGQFLLDNMRANSNCILQIDADNGREIRNKDVLEASVKLACVFKKRGIRKGDRISIACENHPNWLVPACATLYIGAVFAPLNPAYTEREFRHMLDISKPRIIIVSRRTEKILVKVVSSLPWYAEVIQLDDEAHLKTVPTVKELLEAYKTNVDPYRYVPEMIDDTSKQVAVILGSSGTTGLPKGVALSHRNVLRFLATMELPDFVNIQRNDKILVFLPFYHGYAFGLMMTSMATGSTAVFMRSFNAHKFLSLIGKYKITHLPMVPPILVILAKYPSVEKYDFSSVRQVLCGAAPLPKNLVETVLARTRLPFIRNAYGMTELSIVISYGDRRNHENVGNLVPGTLCKVIDHETQEMLGPGQVGELCFKGENVMLGYYNNAKATAETVDRDGWLHSGDLAYYDESGDIYVTGRSKELIKYKGYQVSPPELETVLLSHPGVSDAAVIGKPDEFSGELPMAFVVKQPGSSVTAKEIIEFVNENLSPQKWLRGGVVFTEAIPKNATGKILRRELRTMLSKL